MIALRDQPYTEPSSLERTFDFFRPDTEEVLPLVVYIHGGGWISGDKVMYRDEAVWLAGQGYAAVCLGYRLAPLHPFPAGVIDIQEFLRFIRLKAAEYKIDPTKVVAFGNSAGGHLACMAGLAPYDLGTGLPTEPADGVVAVCPITDVRNPEMNHFPIAFSFLDQFLGGKPEEDYTAASPICYVQSGVPPMQILHGDHDDIVPIQQTLDFCERCNEMHVDFELTILKNEAHSFTFAGWQIVREKLLKLLDQLCK